MIDIIWIIAKKLLSFIKIEHFQLIFKKIKGKSEFEKLGIIVLSCVDKQLSSGKTKISSATFSDLALEADLLKEVLNSLLEKDYLNGYIEEFKCLGIGAKKQYVLKEPYVTHEGKKYLSKNKKIIKRWNKNGI